MPRVIHFEIYTEDTAGSVQFYKDVFGWDISAWEGPFEYHLVTTGPSGTPGIDGAISPPSEEFAQTIVLTMAVDDIDTAIGRAVTAGATLIGNKNEIPGVGLQAYLRDPAGVVLSVLQPEPMPASESAREGDVWSDIGESLKQFGETVSSALSDAAASPQAQRARDEGERALRGIRDASAGAADKARPHVISALDRVSVELGNLASRLRREEAEETPVAEEGATPPVGATEPAARADEPVEYTPPPVDEC